MNILVTNVGSTSLKFKLFDMPDESILASGRIERVGHDVSPCSYTVGNREKVSETRAIPSFAEGLEYVLSVLTAPERGAVDSLEQLNAIGFKVVHARGYSGAQLLTQQVMKCMREYNFILPVHNPPYIKAIEEFRRLLPKVPLVGLFETAFHQTMPEHASTYSIPYDMAQKHGIRRFGFHGASHRYLTERYAEIQSIPLEKVNIITCHLGGSSSITAVRNGTSVDTSFGMSTQSGIPGSTRPGDIDPYILPYLMKREGVSADRICELLAREGGLRGISGLSGDMRELEEAASQGNARAQLAIDVYGYQVIKYIGSYIAVLPEADALVFAGGIGERSASIRRKICNSLEHVGICLDSEKNSACAAEEQMIAQEDSRIKIWVIPTNEEIVVARETYKLCAGQT